MSKQIIYHGSYCEVKQPKIIEGKYTKDFGIGFYCTILEEQAHLQNLDIQHIRLHFAQRNL